LVSKYPGDWELYDMVRDRTELKDLSGVNQAQVDAMAARYRAWAARCGVRDWPVEPRR
jgi:arylsulfatase